MSLINIKGLALGKTKRKDGRYLGRYTHDEKYIYFYGRSYEDLEDKARKLIYSCANPNSTRNKTAQTKTTQQSQTYKQWAEEWLSLYYKENVSATTYKNNSNIFYNHIFPVIGNKKLTDLDGTLIQTTINKCKFSRQRQIIANLLVASLRKAYELDILKQDITKAVKKPKHTSKDSRALTKDEEKKLLNYVTSTKHQLSDYIIFLINSGLRRNEALGLQWKHLDFEKETITVNQQLTIDGKTTKTLKTKKSNRVVKMFPQIKVVFEKIKGDPEKKIFNFSPDYVTRSFKSICETIDIQEFTLHGLRHTFATRCAEKGIANKVVQAWLGHSTINTTLNIYQKTNDEFIEQEFKKILKDFDSETD